MGPQHQPVVHGHDAAKKERETGVLTLCFLLSHASRGQERHLDCERFFFVLACCCGFLVCDENPVCFVEFQGAEAFLFGGSSPFEQHGLLAVHACLHVRGCRHVCQLSVNSMCSKSRTR